MKRTSVIKVATMRNTNDFRNTQRKPLTRLAITKSTVLESEKMSGTQRGTMVSL